MSAATTQQPPAQPAAPAPAQQPGKETVEQALARAQAATQAKRFGEADGICRDVLATSPDHASALALQGVIAAHTGNPERAIELLERALARHPGVASWHANLC